MKTILLLSIPILTLAASQPVVTVSLSPTQSMTLTLCERLAMPPNFRNDLVPVSPTTTFAYKGSVANVIGVLSFNPPVDPSKLRLRVMVTKNGSYADTRDVDYQTGGKTAGIAFTMMPGDYELAIVNQSDPEKVFLKNTFTVAPDTVGERATGNIKAGSGQLMICKEVDDDWKCVGQSTTWKADADFNLYVTMPEAVNSLQTKWVIHKQKPDGTDGDFVDETIMNIAAKSRRWATTEGMRLPAGTYTLYSIAATEAQQYEHKGNLTKYFAKTTLTIK